MSRLEGMIVVAILGLALVSPLLRAEEGRAPSADSGESSRRSSIPASRAGAASERERIAASERPPWIIRIGLDSGIEKTAGTYSLSEMAEIELVIDSRLRAAVDMPFSLSFPSKGPFLIPGNLGICADWLFGIARAFRMRLGIRVEAATGRELDPRWRDSYVASPPRYAIGFEATRILDPLAVGASLEAVWSSGAGPLEAGGRYGSGLDFNLGLSFLEAPNERGSVGLRLLTGIRPRPSAEGWLLEASFGFSLGFSIEAEAWNFSASLGGNTAIAWPRFGASYLFLKGKP